MTMFAKSGKSAAANTRLAMLNVRRELSTRVEFAAEINRLVGQGLETMVEAGRRLTEAKAALPHGEFEAMLREDLDLDPSAAYRLRFVAEFVESGAVPKEDLPGHYSKIFILATLTPEQLGAARSRDLVSPKAAKRQLEAFKSGCEGKGVPAIEDAGIGLLIAAPSAEAAPAAPDARAPDPEEPLPPIMVAESIPLAPADSASLFAKLDEQKDRLTDASQPSANQRPTHTKQCRRAGADGECADRCIGQRSAARAESRERWRRLWPWAASWPTTPVPASTAPRNAVTGC
ncbi:DUF3102 domain-containing protein [Azospirillum baldaniorum]|uniref:DUF3102 domain-containing protein n=1 Tax=Azospirillum baldaniorum TaxID=1064539 RepID=A0A9P1NL90_9PROT|nr:DUF3102 domain-containing protein [Azospirillum baldaniorum]AWJ88281.1 DUF3102 domain-containing protein [Azospirillum baldaniorum]TWA79124.1 DUF3102 family protein [Azospirillum brasilense]CCC96849.1 protein of unknown function [Azospirillum baldaniorum]